MQCGQSTGQNPCRFSRTAAAVPQSSAVTPTVRTAPRILESTSRWRGFFKLGVSCRIVVVIVRKVVTRDVAAYA